MCCDIGRFILLSMKKRGEDKHSEKINAQNLHKTREFGSMAKHALSYMTYQPCGKHHDMLPSCPCRNHWFHRSKGRSVSQYSSKIATDSSVNYSTTTPKKHNSALRKVARVQLTSKFKATVYIPSMVNNLMQYLVALMRVAEGSNTNWAKGLTLLEEHLMLQAPGYQMNILCCG